jgi:hypothetical protein
MPLARASPSTTEPELSTTTTRTRPMSEGPILLSLPSHLHIEDVYLKGGPSKRGAFEVRNDGPDTLNVELASRGGGELDFYHEIGQDKKEQSKSMFKTQHYVPRLGSMQSSDAHTSGARAGADRHPLLRYIA